MSYFLIVVYSIIYNTLYFLKRHNWIFISLLTFYEYECKQYCPVSTMNHEKTHDLILPYTNIYSKQQKLQIPLEYYNCTSWGFDRSVTEK